MRVLAPDWPLMALTAACLTASIATTLAFPMAIGQLFDVVKAHGAAAAAAAPTAASSASSPLLGGGLGGLGLGAVAAAPPTFTAALAWLAICMVLSPCTSAAVAYLAPLLAERFGSRMRKHLMQVGGSRGCEGWITSPILLGAVRAA